MSREVLTETNQAMEIRGRGSQSRKKKEKGGKRRKDEEDRRRKREKRKDWRWKRKYLLSD